MQDSSSVSRNTQDMTSVGISTAKDYSNRKYYKLTDNKLRVRRVILQRVQDENIDHFKSIIQTELPQRLLSQVPNLKDTLDEYQKKIERYPTLSYYLFVDDLGFELDKGKKHVGYPIIHPEYFDAFLQKCRSQNEAMLQRTLMMNIFHPYWLHDMLYYNTEGQWKLKEDVCLPSTQSDKIKMPKPDLAMSFKLSSLTMDKDGADPVPSQLESCSQPDGGFRYFPFLFMELKKAEADLADAERDNLYSASQALYIIYQWTLRASTQEDFFKKVRVFSFVFNVEKLSVRVHRAAMSETGVLRFLFDELFVLPHYTKNQACLLLDSLLENYAVKELHPVLKKTFQIVSQQEVLYQLSKRKAKDARDSSSKRRRTSKNGSEHTGQSFAMSQLNPSDE